MGDVIERHRQDLAELRRTCLLCHGLDLTSTAVFSEKTYGAVSNETAVLLQNMISGNVLQLAVALRINIYQGVLEGDIEVDRKAASIYYMDEMYMYPMTVKKVADKIIHAETFSKDALPKEMLGDGKIAFHLTGSYKRREWVVDICVQYLAEKILTIIDSLEGKSM